YMLFRITVTVEAPAHAQRLHLPDDVHAIYAPVTAFASHADIDMCGMIEIGIIRKVVYPYPFNGFPRFPAFPNFFQPGTVGFNLTVTVHAGFGSRYIRLPGIKNIRVAVLTVKIQLTGMQFMAEGDRLLGHIPNIRVFGRKIIPDS